MLKMLKPFLKLITPKAFRLSFVPNQCDAKWYICLEIRIPV